MAKIVDHYHVSVPVRANAKGAGFLVVLTEDSQGMRAVYLGICGDMETENPQYQNIRFAAACWVMNHGRKCTYQEALHYYPRLCRHGYRN